MTEPTIMGFPYMGMICPSQQLGSKMETRRRARLSHRRVNTLRMKGDGGEVDSLSQKAFKCYLTG